MCIRDSLKFGALQREVGFAHAEARGEGEGRVRLVGHACDVVGARGVEAAVEPGIGGARDRERVLAVELVRLPKQHVDVAAAVELGGVLDAHVGAAAAFGSVPARELVHLEQVRVVEDQALRVFVGELADAGLVRAQDELGDRLERLRSPALHADEGIAIFEARGRHHATHVGMPDRDVVRDARLVGDVEVGEIGPELEERGEHLPVGVDHGALPAPLGRDPRVVAGNAAQQAVA